MSTERAVTRRRCSAGSEQITSTSTTGTPAPTPTSRQASRVTASGLTDSAITVSPGGDAPPPGVPHHVSDRPERLPRQPGTDDRLLDRVDPQMNTADARGQKPRQRGLTGTGQSPEDDEHAPMLPYAARKSRTFCWTSADR